jgi:endo-1,4-beta-xylanase
VRVAVRQVRSAFAVGSFTGYRILEDTADGQRLRQLYQTEFDRLTIPVYWADWGWEKKADLYTRIAQWAGQHADAVRLHCLIYPGRKFLPKRVHPLLLEDIDAFQREALAQIDRVAAALHGVPVSEIDVANELRDLQEDVARMGPQRVAEWFIRARQHWPQAKLCLNDNNIINSGGVRSGNRDYLVGWVQRLRDLGAAPDVVGVQGHFGEAVTPPERVWQILDELHQRTGCELQITEFDLVTNDRLVQADYTRDLLLALAAHPAVTGITWWGCWAGDQWKPQAAWWEKDWTPRPVVDAVLPLIRSWRTTVDGVTDQDGVVRFAAWLGTVSVEALTADGRIATTSLTVAAPGVPASAKLSVE